VDKITGAEMHPLEFLRNMIDATAFELYYGTNMTAEEIFFEITSAVKDFVDVVNEPNDEDEFEEEMEKKIDQIIKTHSKGGENTPSDNTHLN